jgi:hypothetical protein
VAGELSKQEEMNQKRLEAQEEVRAIVIFECGVCGFSNTVRVKPDDNGLIVMPDAYCGACSKNMNFRPINWRVVKMEVKTRKEWDLIDNPVTVDENGEVAGEVTNEPTARTEQAAVPEKKKGSTKKS